MRLIPGKTKVRMELFKGVSLTDLAIAGVAMGLMLLVFVSNLEGKLYCCIGIGFLAALLLVRFDTEPSYIYVLRILRHMGVKRNYEKATVNDENPESFDDFFRLNEETDTVQPSDTKQQKILEKQLFREEKKILSSKTATKEEKDNVWKARASRTAKRKKDKKKQKYDNIKYESMGDIISFTGIKDGYIEYNGEYYGTAIEIPAVEFRFFSQTRRDNTIENGVGRILRCISSEYCANIVKIDRPVLFDSYIEKENIKLQQIRLSYQNGLINEDELKSRCEMIYQRIDELKALCYDEKVVVPYYYIVLFDSTKKQLDITVQSALEYLRGGELNPKQLNSKELAVFLRYTNEIDFDEREIEKVSPENYANWAMPKTVSLKARTTEINDIITHNMRVIGYPGAVDDGWMVSLMSIPATKVVIKCKPLDSRKAISSIDRSIQEINERLQNTGIESRIIELSAHAESLSALLMTLQGDNESLLSVNIYLTCYDINQTRNTPMPVQPPKSMRSDIPTMKKTVRRMFSEGKFRLESMEFNQLNGFIGSQISGFDPLTKHGRGIPSNTIAASFPWVYANIFDENGVKLGFNDGVPVFVDFFKRDNERINSNMVIVGKSGSGKSYATKSILSNLAADDTKIFILDPENEYSELAHNLKGKIINVGNASQGRLNPFQIITALDDEDEDSENSSYATHLQFLEEFFKQSLVDCEKDALEYLNALIDRTYMKKGIDSQTNLSRLKPEDYPIFDDLYDTILSEFQTTENPYVRSMLRTLINYISKYSTGGRNANIWNGPSSITTDENFTVFNFQSLLANRNSIIANSQMLLVLKYIDNEIIKNRDYNNKFNTNRKIVIVIDEAHVFIDAKYPIALDFMYQLAKRIRKYNGMQIVITQNIKDFVGSEEIARKSTAIINACQYSFIFSLAPNDMEDLCRLYEKSGGINEMEQEQIVSAPRGQAFVIFSAQNRATFKIKVVDGMVRLFRDADYQTERFAGVEGEESWNNYIGKAKAERELILAQRFDASDDETEELFTAHSSVTFEEISAEEFDRQNALKVKQQALREAEVEARIEAMEKYKEDIKDKAKQNVDNIYSDIDYDTEVNLSNIISGVSQDTVPTVAPENDGIFIPDEIQLPVQKQEEIHLPVQLSADVQPQQAQPANVQPQQVQPQQLESANVQPQLTQPDKIGITIEDVLMKMASIMENMQKLNYDTIAAEIESRLTQSGFAPAQQATQATAELSENEFDKFLSSIYSGDDEEIPLEDEIQIEPIDSDNVQEFDILSFLAEQADDEPEYSVVDDFLESDEMVVAVTLDELIEYNLSIHNR